MSSSEHAVNLTAELQSYNTTAQNLTRRLLLHNNRSSDPDKASYNDYLLNDTYDYNDWPEDPPLFTPDVIVITILAFLSIGKLTDL